MPRPSGPRKNNAKNLALLVVVWSKIQKGKKKTSLNFFDPPSFLIGIFLRNFLSHVILSLHGGCILKKSDF